MQAATTSTRKLSIRRPSSRQGRRAQGVRMLAFFASILVVGWFGLSGIDIDTDTDESGPTRQLIFAGGSPRLAVVENPPAAGQDGATAQPGEEGDIIGRFGEPTDEFYANDDQQGGWGDAAIERRSNILADARPRASSRAGD